jgi:hypothetical protein
MITLIAIGLIVLMSMVSMVWMYQEVRCAIHGSQRCDDTRCAASRRFIPSIPKLLSQQAGMAFMLITHPVRLVELLLAVVVLGPPLVVGIAFGSLLALAAAVMSLPFYLAVVVVVITVKKSVAVVATVKKWMRR